MLRAAYLERRHEIRDRLQEFRAVPREEYFFELVYCLLTPQSSARNANVVTGILRVRDFALRPFDPETILRNGSHYIRFHKTKSVRLLQMTTMFGEVDRQLHIGLSAEQLRQWLVDHVNGLGMKEATHFLRNIGKNDGLAILDRHILRHLMWSGVIPEVPTSLTKNRYREIEKKFDRFARTLKIRLDELDLLFWSLQTGEILK